MVPCFSKQFARQVTLEFAERNGAERFEFVGCVAVQARADNGRQSIGTKDLVQALDGPRQERHGGRIHVSHEFLDDQKARFSLLATDLSETG